MFELHAMLLAVERQMARHANAAVEGAALLTRARGNPGDYRHSHRSAQARTTFRGACWKCGREGHTRRNCPQNTDKGGHGTDGSSPVGSLGAACFALMTKSYADAARAHVLTKTQPTKSTIPDARWIIDSGASRHMTANRNLLENIRACSERIRVADDREVSASAVGDAWVSNVLLSNVLFVPGLAHSLISVPALTAEGARVKFEHDRCCVEGKNVNWKLEGKLQGGLYALRSSTAQTRAKLEHQRLCHPSDESFCDTCVRAKAARRSYPASSQRAEKPLELVHSDLLTITPQGFRGERYVVTLLDEATGLAGCFPIRHKSETLTALKSMVRAMEAMCGHSVRALRTDKGTEYVNAPTRAWADASGIRLESGPPFVPQMNGSAERFNRTLLERVRAVVLAKGLNKHLWPELAPAVCYVLNRSPNTRGTVPIVACGKSGDLDHLRVLGSRAYVYERGPDKLDARARAGILVGYGERHKVYRILLNGTQTVVEATNVRIIEEDQAHELEATHAETETATGLVHNNGPDVPRLLHESGGDTADNTGLASECRQVTTEEHAWTLDEDEAMANSLISNGWNFERAAEHDDLRRRSPLEILQRARDLGLTEQNFREMLYVNESEEDAGAQRGRSASEEQGLTHTMTPRYQHERGEPVQQDSPPPAPRRSERLRRPPARFWNSPEDAHLSVVMATEPTPCAYVTRLITQKEELETMEAKEAIKKELGAMISMSVFDPDSVIEYDEARKHIGAQFVRGKLIVSEKFVEQDANRRVLKARLVAQGCLVYDCNGHLVRDNTFQYEKPIGLRSARIAIAHGRIAGDLATFDVDSAYLSTELKGPKTFLELPMEARPESWGIRFARPVVPLIKALYGLPRSGADFGADARQKIIKQGWAQASGDMNMYFKAFGCAKVLMALYVDDGLLAGDPEAVDKAILEICAIFKISKAIKRMSKGGNVTFLGMTVDASPDAWSLHTSNLAQVASALQDQVTYAGKQRRKCAGTLCKRKRTR
ncbi:Retrovirus-related Pol polyprotein from transposon TNT 1-94 [Porphyridium purpureum]|uniref:Retrovirus-related Pol polyprotein from transposon TNT 1-94 n=1 Tax=Porphyridium purpureum TaxID=35688 RepID=A0A5J4YKY5_PORPP|nr:Retrovirus-related Pol polyprotein from transposon TNT 1-94 [Porphyridium purpureum]|eukprot:POR5074..scf291_13